MDGWRMVVTGVAVVLVVGGVGLLFARADAGGEQTPPPPGPAPTSGSPATGPVPTGPVSVADFAGLFVRDGDRVAASGRVVASPGQPVRFCRLGVEPATTLPGPPTCSYPVTVTGADLDRLTDRRVDDGTVSGTAWFEGTYRAKRLTVSRQGPARQESMPTGLPEVPCPPPSGGWIPGQIQNDPAVAKVHAYVAEHPTEYGTSALGYPDPAPATPLPTTDPDWTGTQVVIVRTLLPIDQATARLRTLWSGNLCVTRAEISKATSDAVMAEVSQSRPDGSIPASWDRYGITLVTAEADDRVTVGVTVLDEPTRSYLAGVDAKRGVLRADPWLRPVR